MREGKRRGMYMIRNGALDGRACRFFAFASRPVVVTADHEGVATPATTRLLP